MSAAAVQLAVVGHTNTGKTSLLRTLTRDSGFGEVSDRPATTRDVAGSALLVDGRPALALYDTPGLEDAIGLADYLKTVPGEFPDPVALVDAFLAGDHDHGRYEQEAKVLRQLRRSDAALYVVDAREPVLAKHRDELRLLAHCGKPVMPVLNFIASREARPDTWREQLARLGLHVLAEFDTVVLDYRAEHRLFEKLALVLEPQRRHLMDLLEAREREREAVIAAACRAAAELLIDAAGCRLRVAAGGDLDAGQMELRDRVRRAEQRYVDTVLSVFRFELDLYRPPELPLEDGRWSADLFDPETLKVLGIKTGSAAAAGGMAGLAVDAVTGGLTLGAAAALGAGLGAAWSATEHLGRPLLDRLRGHRLLALDEPVLAALAARAVWLLDTLIHRGHASHDVIVAGDAKGWPSDALRQAVRKARAHPDWSRLNDGEDGAPEWIVASVRRAVREVVGG